MEPLIPLASQWVENDEQLSACCQTLASAAAVAVDTEFMRTDTFYPKAALFQLADHQCCYLIDPLAVNDFAPLVSLLQNPAVIKVMHACSEDLEVFSRILGCLPTPMVDTQIAAALANVASGMGYANLVETLTGVQLPKGETRSDWLQRPLSDEQIRYAVLDVTYLLPVYHMLCEQLQEQGRLPWLTEECERQLAAASEPVNVDGFYPRIKLAWKLSLSQLAVLRALSAWRETEARHSDKPRNHVLHETVLMALAQQQPTDIASLAHVEDLHTRKIKRYGEQLIKVIQQAQQLPAEDYPAPMPQPLTPPERQLLKQLKLRVNAVAEAEGLPPEILARKADLEFMIRAANAAGDQLPSRLQGWRKAVIGEPLLQLLAG